MTVTSLSFQYVPDPVRDERVNKHRNYHYGGEVLTRFLSDWHRVKTLWGKDAVDPPRLQAMFRGVTEESLMGMIDTWKNSIQFSKPSGSLRSIDETLEVAAGRFLVEPEATEKNYKSHSDLVVFARLTLIAELTLQLGAEYAKSHVRRDMEFPGRTEIPRRFDLGVRNEKLDTRSKQSPSQVPGQATETSRRRRFLRTRLPGSSPDSGTRETTRTRAPLRERSKDARRAL